LINSFRFFFIAASHFASWGFSTPFFFCRVKFSIFAAQLNTALPRNPLDICRAVLMPRPILFSRGLFHLKFYRFEFSFLAFKFYFIFQIILILKHTRTFFFLGFSMGIVDDRTSEYLEEIRRAMEASREEAGLPPSTTAAPSLEEIAAAVRESGLVGALNNIAATTISTTVSL
jgi:hypothetical protein